MTKECPQNALSALTNYDTLTCLTRVLTFPISFAARTRGEQEIGNFCAQAK